jgi:hypothetical protein
MQPIITNILFYDGPQPPQGIFDKFLAIPSISSDVKTRSFTSLVDNTGSHAIDNLTYDLFEQPVTSF